MIPAQPFREADDSAANFSLQSTHAVPSAYYQRLHPWCIVRQLPKMQRLVVSRFRQRTEAESHLQVLRQLAPEAQYELIFDP